MLSNLGDQKCILGYPWFAAMQPNIDYAKGWLDHAQLPIVLRAENAGRAQFRPRFNHIRQQHTLERRVRKRRQEIMVEAIQNFGTRLQTTNIHDETPEEVRAKIPEQYHRFWKVFSDLQSQRFPPSRPWDHAIKLKPGAPASLPGKVYPAPPKEREFWSNFTQEALKKGYIRIGEGPYVTPTFTIPKKNGKLRPVQDYQRLNEWTIRNHYPLPLIPQLIDRMRGCTLFTKFDIRWGYNNVQIKDGDQWKAAFLTHDGLFEPMVMYFGLTNSPATFQTMMDTIFGKEMRENWLTIYMDDMGIHTRRLPGESEEQHVSRHRTYVT
jgi:hypothetical protein